MGLPLPVAECPLCAQCQKSMVLVVCQPDFHDPMVATFRCRECGLLDRAEVESLREIAGTN
jgi:C4-type Zn-finger protein